MWEGRQLSGAAVQYDVLVSVALWIGYALCLFAVGRLPFAVAPLHDHSTRADGGPSPLAASGGSPPIAPSRYSLLRVSARLWTFSL
eukprot:1722794-Prymnesium_polylepis.1